MLNFCFFSIDLDFFFLVFWNEIGVSGLLAVEIALLLSLEKEGKKKKKKKKLLFVFFAHQWTRSEILFYLVTEKTPWIRKIFGFGDDSRLARLETLKIDWWLRSPSTSSALQFPRAWIFWWTGCYMFNHQVQKLRIRWYFGRLLTVAWYDILCSFMLWWYRFQLLFLLFFLWDDTFL